MQPKAHELITVGNAVRRKNGNKPESVIAIGNEMTKSNVNWFKQILAVMREHGIRCRIGRMWRAEHEEVFLILEGVSYEDLEKLVQAKEEAK